MKNKNYPRDAHCHVLIWGAYESNIYQALSGYNPGHTALRFTFPRDSVTEEEKTKIEGLKGKGLPVYEYHRDEKDYYEIYFSFWPEENETDQLFQRTPKKTVNSYFITKHIQDTYPVHFATLGEDLIDQRSGKSYAKRKVGIGKNSLGVALDPTKSEHQRILNDRAQRKLGNFRRQAQVAPLTKHMPLKLREVKATLTDKIKEDLRSFLISHKLQKPDENSNNEHDALTKCLTQYSNDVGDSSLQRILPEGKDLKTSTTEELKSALNKANQYLTADHFLRAETVSIYEEIEATHEYIRAEELTMQEILSYRKQHKQPPQELKERHRDLLINIQIQQRVLSHLGYASESSLGQEPEAALELTPYDFDLSNAIDALSTFTEHKEGYHIAAKNCSSAALSILSNCIMDQEICKKFKELGELQFGKHLYSPRSVFKFLQNRHTPRSNRTLLQRIIHLLKSLIRRKKTNSETSDQFRTTPGTNIANTATDPNSTPKQKPAPYKPEN